VDLPAAKREAAVTWIKVELFRSGGSAVLRRFMQEIDARRVIADVMTISDPAEVLT
jgi:iron(III) transport system substrate-binding protein